VIHWLWYGPKRGVYAKPQARCGMAVLQTQLTGSERRVTCPRCLAIMHATEPEGPITQTRDSRGNPGHVSEEGPAEHLRNALSILRYFPGEEDLLPSQQGAVLAITRRVEKALQQLVDRRVNIPLSRRSRRGNVHQSNPALAILGANPRVEDATVATWAKIEYTRPDDPDGKRIIRVHEFKDGFEIGWLSDGSVQLSHPKHALWMEDGER